jgi:hypothetical protein
LELHRLEAPDLIAANIIVGEACKKLWPNERVASVAVQLIEED